MELILHMDTPLNYIVKKNMIVYIGPEANS